MRAAGAKGDRQGEKDGCEHAEVQSSNVSFRRRLLEEFRAIYRETAGGEAPIREEHFRRAMNPEEFVRGRSYLCYWPLVGTFSEPATGKVPGSGLWPRFALPVRPSRGIYSNGVAKKPLPRE